MGLASKKCLWVGISETSFKTICQQNLSRWNFKQHNVKFDLQRPRGAEEIKDMMKFIVSIFFESENTS